MMPGVPIATLSTITAASLAMAARGTPDGMWTRIACTAMVALVLCPDWYALVPDWYALVPISAAVTIAAVGVVTRSGPEISVVILVAIIPYVSTILAGGKHVDVVHWVYWALTVALTARTISTTIT